MERQALPWRTWMAYFEAPLTRGQVAVTLLDRTLNFADGGAAALLRIHVMGGTSAGAT